MWSSADPANRLALALLDRLESLESRLLVWAYTDGFFDQSEIEELAQEVIEEAGEFEPPQVVVDRLRDRKLLFEFNMAGATVYRTRFAEAVRLFASLRQLFSDGDWATAPRLVADYRLALGPRRYPARNRTVEDVLSAVADRRPLLDLEDRLVRAMLTRSGEPMCLARFQVEATARILGEPGGQTQGTIICAGTGTGKTVAFYLPCFARLATRLSSDPWVQALAIYPRNELLKDQFSEACTLVRRVKSTIFAAKGRGIRIGAFFGSTPNDASIRALEDKNWPKSGADYVCPYLRCPNPKCQSDLVWRRQDVVDGVARLVCRECSAVVDADEVLLTRRAMQQTPPDLLFTTTEMLNRHMSSQWSRQLLGLDRQRHRSPHTMLLDEIHTYRGAHGAHVALLLSRWRHAVRYPVHFVGLSATLTDPQGFMAKMVGLSPGAVTPIHAASELEEEGREYHLVLRGDPASATSLLSTTIQSTMLLARVMDPMVSPQSHDAFGRKVFVFTDDLDVTNRLYHNLLDAEGRDSAGREYTSKEPLASYRGQRHLHDIQRFGEGQVWSLCTWVGHDLDNPGERLRVGRVSSQDTGVGGNDQVIVATSALEVGYNDPMVGAIIQHKAPRDPASFLQRKGRAGRLRDTRPWTVVVLSDYGRDRVAYQAYEHLLSPVLQTPTLPIGNRYVLRIQAVYALMEWVTSKLPDSLGKATVWSDFTRPGETGDVQSRQQWEANLLNSVLAEPEQRDELATYLGQALRLSDDEIRSLLWEPPRALLTAVVPTLLRRLRTGWRRVSPMAGAVFEAAADYQKANTPLPDFVPDNLFSDLNVPEVRILTERHGRPDPDEASMPIAQALRTFPPGRVTRRFGVQHIRAAHWVAPPDLVGRFQTLPVESYCQDYEEVGTFEAVIGDTVTSLRCVRPWTIAAAACPQTVKNTSNAVPVWHSQFCPPTVGDEGDLPEGCPLCELLRAITFFTHNGGAPLCVRRFSVGSEAEIRLSNGKEHTLSIRFTEGSTKERVAVGFEQDVDGILFVCHIDSVVVQRAFKGPAMHACRTAYFRHMVESDPVLRERADRFRLEWLAQVYLSVVLTHAVEHQLDVLDTVGELEQLDWIPLVSRALDRVFQVIDAPEDGAEGPDSDGTASRTKVHDALRELFAMEAVRDRLITLSRHLWMSPDEGFEHWLRQRLKATLGAALLDACYRLVPQFQTGDLLLDIDSGPRPATAPTLPVGESHSTEDEIWITESVIGGSGIVEEIRRSYSEDPRRFYLLAEMGLAPSDLETVDREITRLIGLACVSDPVQAAFNAVRCADSNRAARSAQENLRHVLQQHRVLVSHAVVTALNARILRPGSSPQVEALLERVLRQWRDEERRLGIEIDSRIFCFVAATDAATQKALGEALNVVGVPDEKAEALTYARLYALLWPRGSAVRERSLEVYNPFAWLPKVDPLMLAGALDVGLHTVRFGGDGWLAAVEEALSIHGVVVLEGSASQRNELASAVLSIVASAVDSAYLQLYPYVARAQSIGETTAITFHIREAVQ